ncbi:unnamed protein product [Adineta steineri]|uniref:Uncharacterized protein n=1 Tax=Adineta steineri TaxID=433720 RepID=A0A820S5H0_9BILA|nr:unnamed protein product [Adineta steineri]
MSNNTFIGNNQINNEKSHIERRHSSTKHRNENDDDEGAVWSVSSNGGLSRSSHDDGFVFQSKYDFIKSKD